MKRILCFRTRQVVVDPVFTFVPGLTSLEICLAKGGFYSTPAAAYQLQSLYVLTHLRHFTWLAQVHPPYAALAHVSCLTSLYIQVPSENLIMLTHMSALQIDPMAVFWLFPDTLSVLTVLTFL